MWAVVGLFDVLDLFADFFQFAFGLDDSLGDAGVVGLRADGVEFAVDFLAEEVERTAGRFGTVEIFVEFPQVRIEARQFFRNITTVGEQRDFPRHPLVIRLQVEPGIAQTLVQQLAIARGAVRRVGSDLAG